MKGAYVLLMQSLRAGLRAVGVLGLLDRWAQRSTAGLWVRSLLSIYDVEELLGLDVPWWTFESSRRVEAFLRGQPGAAVFEWGSGASSVWLARRSDRVISIEHDSAWAESLRGMTLPKVTVRCVGPLRTTTPATPSHKPGFEGLDFTDYVAAINDVEGMFDLIVIDGRAREACLAAALPRLAPGGLIVFDNVDRRRYRDAISAASQRLDVTWTRGLTPSLPYPTRTALIRVS